MLKTLSVSVTAAVVAAVAAPVVADAHQPTRFRSPSSVSRQCRTEDSVNCTWDANRSGNHRGRSFIVRRMPHSNEVCYLFLASKDAKRDHCEVVR